MLRGRDEKLGGREIFTEERNDFPKSNIKESKDFLNPELFSFLKNTTNVKHIIDEAIVPIMTALVPVVGKYEN